MNTLIKWPGGKAREIKYIESLIPQHSRYIEPFFGGGAMFFYLQPKDALINDISSDLMLFYSYAKSNDIIFRNCLNEYVSVVQGMLLVCDANCDTILELYEDIKASKLTKEEQREKITSLLRNNLYNFDYPIILDVDAFLLKVASMAMDKIARTIINDAKSPFSSEDLIENLITGFISGIYMYFRDVYNDIHLGRTTTISSQYRIANFYFIREYCYGSMFRYNNSGEFNIPYGGMSYNRKDFQSKIDYIFSSDVSSLLAGATISCEDFADFMEHNLLTEDDFMFLDPPYDTEFSDYEGKDFTQNDQIRLAEQLEKTKAKFVLIIKNTDFIYSLYNGKHNIICFNKTYTYNVRSRNDRNAEHLIITNLPI